MKMPPLILLFLFNTCSAIVVGSDTTVSRPTRTTFPAADTNNTILGFVAMENGLRFENSSTTCTYNAFFPLSSVINLRSGKLCLNQDCYFDTDATIIRGARIEGNSYNFQFYPRDASFTLPTSYGISNGIGDITLLDTESVVAQVNAVDWSYGNTFVVSASNAGTGNLRLFVMDGNRLTATTNGSVTLGNNAIDIRWHPTLYYVAIARAYSTTAGRYELTLYRRNVSNGTFSQVQGFDYGAQASAVSWHPSGNYLAVATNDTTREIILYSFSGTVLSLLTSVNLSPNTTFNPGTISWSPDGKYLVLGTNTRSSVELLLYYFNGSTLTSTNAGIELGQNVQAVDWSPTGSYIAVGIGGGSDRLRIYKHLAYNGTLIEITTARVGMSVTAKSLEWATDGQALLVGTSNTTSSVINLYSFNQIQETLTLFDTITTVASPVNGIRYARDAAPYFTIGKTNSTVQLYGFDGFSNSVPFYFNNTNLIFDSDVAIVAPCYFEGNCKVTTNNAALIFKNNGAFIIKPGGHLEINKCLLNNIHSNNFGCMTNNGEIALNSCSVWFDRDYTFSCGALSFVGDVLISTTNKFTYATSRTSTIMSNSIVGFDVGFTFSYDPPGPYRNLIYFESSSAVLHFDNADLRFTRTGLDFTNGTLEFDNHCTLSTQARNLAEGIYFGPFINVNFLANAQWDLFGFIKIG